MFQAAPCHVVLHYLTGPYSDDRMTQNCLQSLLKTVNFLSKHVFLLFCFFSGEVLDCDKFRVDIVAVACACVEEDSF